MRIAAVEQGQRLGSRNAVHVMRAAEDGVLGRIERVHQISAGREVTLASDRAEGEEEHDEDGVQDRNGWLEEVVVVAGDELAQLVDEGAEAKPAEDGRQRS